MLGISRLDYARLRRHWRVIYAVLLLSILAVLGLGHSANGAQRAINFPLFSFQASELGKILLILALSALIVERARHLRERDTTVRVLIAALVPTMLVIVQPDLGSGLVYMTIACMLLFVAGTSWRHLAALAALVCVSIAFVLVAAPAVGVHVLKPYQVERLTAFIHPNSNAQKESESKEREAKDGEPDPSYQQQQSKIAIGSGGKTGRGPNASQVPYGFVPESDTDFIFAALGEKYGFVGAGLVLALYALLISRTLRVLVMSKDLFGSLIAAGDSGYAHVSGLRQRRDDNWNHADHGSHASAHELRRLVGDRNPAGRGPAPIDLRPGACFSSIEGPRTALVDPECPPSDSHNILSAAGLPASVREARPAGGTRGAQACRRVANRVPLRGPCGVRSPARLLSTSKDWIKLKKQVLVSVDRAETRVALLEAGGTPAASRSSAAAKKSAAAKRSGKGPEAGYRVAELYIERRGGRSIVGNIYKGKVDNVLPGMEAAFVDIGLEKNGFLHVDEIVLPGVETPRRGRGSGGGRKIQTC